MKKKILYILMMAMVSLALMACGNKDTSAVDEANANYDPAQQRLEDKDPKAVMDATKAEFSRDDVTFYTYRVVNDVISMRAKVTDEAKIEEVVRTFADAFAGSQLSTLEFEVRDVGTYKIPLNEDYSDLSQFLEKEE